MEMRLQKELKMRDWQKEAGRFIDNLIYVWMQDPSLNPLIAAVRNQERNLTEEVASILAREGESLGKRADKARSFVLRSALEQLPIHFQTEHFVLFRQADTVEFILESAFGAELASDIDKVIIPHQQEVAQMLARCLFAVRDKSIDLEDITTFLHLFTGRENAKLDQDKTMRYKSMVWFAYLSIALVTTDAVSTCKKGISYFKIKCQTLLRGAMEGKIINEDELSLKPDYEHGKWNDTLFGWMQGDESKPFLEKLWKQLNLDNKADHGNRVLLPEHRDCIYRQAAELFC